MSTAASNRSGAGSATRRLIACCSLLVAVVFSHWLGVAHSSLHAESASASHAGHTHATGSHDTSTRWLSMLFGEHGSGSDCRLYDQVSHGDCAPTLTPVRVPSPPIPLSATAVTERLWGAVPGWARARGPPFIR